MIKFIYVCMGVVALSALSVAGQFLFTGIDGAQQDIAARNAEEMPIENPVATEVAVQQTEEETFSPEVLNAIETAAGASNDDGFGNGFTDKAPVALADDPMVRQLEVHPSDQE